VLWLCVDEDVHSVAAAFGVHHICLYRAQGVLGDAALTLRSAVVTVPQNTLHAQEMKHSTRARTLLTTPITINATRRPTGRASLSSHASIRSPPSGPLLQRAKEEIKAPTINLVLIVIL
jgi:hypothetical protein